MLLCQGILVLPILIGILWQQTHAQISFSNLPCYMRQAKIVGGQEAQRHEMPYIVSLTRRGGHFCGASIINNRWLLSAGHCMCNGFNKLLKAAQIQGVMGLHSISEYLNGLPNINGKELPLRVNFKNIITHPQYECAKTKHDIELLEPIKFSEQIQPTCLAYEGGSQVLEHQLATVSGWGWTHENQEQGDRANALQKAAVRIWSNSNCEKSYRINGKGQNFISDTQMCAGFTNGQIDACWADSGGPLISQDNVLIGVVSTGIGCARPGLPGIYTRVSKYKTWIESVILDK